MSGEMDSAEQAVGGHGGPAERDEEDRRAVLAQLSGLDDLSAADEEEIDRFRSFVAAPATGRGHTGLGRVVGHFIPHHRRVAS